MYSGGLDAYAVDKLCEPDKKVFVQMGTDESKEESALLAVNGDDVEVVQAEFISQFERDNKVIPYRNTLLTLIGAQYGTEVMLGATQGDGKDTADTTTPWAGTVTAMLQQHVGPHRAQETAPKVSLPVKSYTKAELVDRLVYEKDIPMGDILTETKSCHYGGTDQGCGECFGCVRRFVAFAKNSRNLHSHRGDRLHLDEITTFFQSDIVEYIAENERGIKKKFEGRSTELAEYKEVLETLGLEFKSLSVGDLQ